MPVPITIGEFACIVLLVFVIGFLVGKLGGHHGGNS